MIPIIIDTSGSGSTSSSFCLCCRHFDRSMAPPSLTKLRTYLHLVPVFGTVLSLWTLYGEPKQTAQNRSELSGKQPPDIEAPPQDAHQRLAASKLSVILGLGCVGAIALLGAGASTQASQMASLRFLIASSLVGSGYFLLSLTLMFRVATNQSIRLPGISSLSRRLP